MLNAVTRARDVSARILVRAGLAAVAGMAFFACGEGETRSPAISQDAAAAADGANTGGAAGDAALPFSGSCGGQACVTPIGATIAAVTACCMDNGSCGLTSPTVEGKCLAPRQPGNRDPSCNGFEDPRGGYFDGCCGPSGCGALNPWIGCIANADLGRAAQACEYDPTNNCDVLTSLTCDGAEDCPNGELCCSRYDGSIYAEFGCFPSCVTMLATGSTGAEWRQICHAGDTCEDPAAACATTSRLPSTLGRCSATASGAPPDPATDSSAGRVNCGSTLCETGEQCCLREPGGEYCAPAGTPCRCHLPDGG